MIELLTQMGAGRPRERWSNKGPIGESQEAVCVAGAAATPTFLWYDKSIESGAQVRLFSNGWGENRCEKRKDGFGSICWFTLW